MQPTITVFTPAYNRGYIIHRLFESLKKQTFNDFEWVVVDDGSSDNTSNLFQSFIEEAPFFKITYEKTQNGGKHRAINRGLELASGKLFFIVDSDDHLTENALEIINSIEESIPLDQKSFFAGVCGNRCYQTNNIIGSTFDSDVIDITMLERSKYNILGDKAEVFYTDTLKKYPFPTFDNEKFLTECVVWDKIAYDGLKLRFFNQSIYVCDYLDDGLTNQGMSVFINNPKGYGLFLYQSKMFKKGNSLSILNQYGTYYKNLNKTLTIREMLNNLNCSPFYLLLGILTSMFYKFYHGYKKIKQNFISILRK